MLSMAQPATGGAPKIERAKKARKMFHLHVFTFLTRDISIYFCSLTDP